MAFESSNNQGTFSWQPSCELITQFGQNDFDLTFKVRTTATKCLPDGISNEVAVQIKLKNSPNTEFLPPNAFSPNGDGIGEVFELTSLPTAVCGEEENPFKQIQIYSRWGKLVFESNKEDFAWDAKNVQGGVYMVYLKLEKSEYNWMVTVFK